MKLMMPNESLESDHNFEEALSIYINAVIAAEGKKVYKSFLQPFSVREQEIRNKMQESFHLFQNSFAKGYRTLVEELKQDKSSSDLLPLAKVEPGKLKFFSDTEGLMKALEEGNSIYELLGFKEESLNVFYHKTIQLMEHKKFERARDICHFLVTIAPGVSQFWILLGKCDANLHAYETAIIELLRAIELDPTEVIAYLDLIDLFLEMREFNKASGLCDVGMQFAQEHRNEPWSEPLRTKLEAEKRQIRKE